MPRLVVVALAVAGMLFAAPAANAAGVDYNHNAVIFVHGFVGSGAQFESQKLRFTSNGYPDSYVTVFEYDSTTALATEPVLFAQLDQLIAHMQSVTHRPQVDLLAHSLGTKLMQDYLTSSPQRAATVGHYVNIDGQTASSPPGGVPTLAVWASKGPTATPGRSIGGAENVTIPDVTHVQCATSSLSFWWYYDFFNGKPPATTQIMPQSGQITLSGRAVLFPNNTGMDGSTVQVWAINQATGRRTSSAPIASFLIDQTGDWGPVAVTSGRRYEFTLVRPGVPLHHFYYEPFIRSDHLIRLLESDALRSAGGPPDPRSVAMVIIRYKEFWGDQGSENDILTLNGLNVCNANTCPIKQLVNGVFAGDFDHDQASNLSQPWPTYSNIPFLTGVDVYMPAESPPTGQVTVGLVSRSVGPERTLTFPDFPGTTDVETVQLNDFEQ